MAAQSPKSVTRLLAEEVVAATDAGNSSACPSPPASSASAGEEAAAVEGSTPSKASPAKAVKTGKLPPPPPVVTMSLSMKTVVSPRTHTHEVVALSALIHREVRLDGASDDDGQKVGGWVGVVLSDAQWVVDAVGLGWDGVVDLVVGCQMCCWREAAV